MSQRSRRRGEAAVELRNLRRRRQGLQGRYAIASGDHGWQRQIRQLADQIWCVHQYAQSAEQNSAATGGRGAIPRFFRESCQYTEDSKTKFDTVSRRLISTFNFLVS